MGVVHASRERMSRSFIIANDTFVLDGKTVTLAAGCIHYSRVHPALWQDRLMRLRSMGLNAIQTYVPWNWHNPAPGSYSFDGACDLVHFIQLAQTADLLVILRAGPYMCGEWDFGGLPPWLLAMNPSVVCTYSAHLFIV